MEQTGLRTAPTLAVQLQRARFVSQHYHELCGGCAVPVGFALMTLSNRYLSACSQLAVTSKTVILTLIGYAASLMEVVVLGALLALARPVSRYYDRHFGVMEPTRRSLSWFFGAFLIGQSQAILGGINQGLLWQVDFFALGFGWYLGRRPGAWKERPYCGLLAVLWMAASLAPLWVVPRWIGPVRPFPQEQFEALGDFVRIGMGLSIIVIGLLDHLLLTHYLPPPPREEAA
jgi:hypothetical protein